MSHTDNPARKDKDDGGVVSCRTTLGVFRETASVIFRRITLGIFRGTTLGLVFENLSDEPSEGVSAWARTTAGLVALLLALQLITGVLLAFYFVPSAESAYATVAYVEKVVGAGSWVRALHFYGSQLLPLALVLHLAQTLWRGAFIRRPIGWVASVLLLALSLGNGATGYSLPWDARAFFSTRVAENVTGGLPLLGETLRAWLVGGSEISTLTLSRFFALHTLVVPALLLAVVCARLFVLREPGVQRHELSSLRVHDESRSNTDWLRTQFARNVSVASLAFAALSLYAWKYPAPLGPSIETAPPGYLPRPGAQFVWLFQLLKLFPGTIASLVAFFLPALLLGALALLPFTRTGSILNEANDSLSEANPHSSEVNTRRRRFGKTLLVAVSLLIAVLTAVAYLQDARDPRVREQFARQAQREAEFRAEPFKPVRAGATAAQAGAQTAPASSSNSAQPGSSNSAQPGSSQAAEPPEVFRRNCAKCHGAHGEGKSINPSLIGVSARPHRSPEDIVAILNNPASYGLESRMPSFARKLSEDEKRAVAEWIVSLK
ncbi:MAG: ubiquinol-cytochrome c reductase cytochrome b subunit [Acidobacteriota bacterium]|jgi:ubiquinol-cytochrome c reductase cytochrome b subunit|nr:ubiquinol-cytochrome c reductase cytochrome b subunit [Acidobacteriota bacterium]